MNFETVKKTSDVRLEGVSVDFEIHDKGIRSIVIADRAGNLVKIMRGESYNETLRVLVPEQPKPVKVHVLAGKLLGITPFREEFEQQYEADSRLSAIKSETGIYDAEKLGLAITEETVMRVAAE